MNGETVEYQSGDILLDVVARTRALEGQYNLLRDRVLVVNQNLSLIHI